MSIINAMLAYIKKLLKLTLTVLLSMAVAVLLLVVLAIGLVASLGDKSAVEVPQNAVLVFDMEMLVRDAPHSTDPFFSLSGMDPDAGSCSLRSVIRAIDNAAEDSRIRILLLRGGSFGANIANIGEIREAVARFRGHGKRVVAFLDDADMKEYLLASSADEIWISPLSYLGLQGFCIEKVYLGEALAKRGIGVEVVDAGRYKSAPDFVDSSSMSKEDREQLEAFLGDLWAEWKRQVLASRGGLNDAFLDDVSKNVGFVDSEAALRMGLVDRVANEDELRDWLCEECEAEDDYPSVTLQDYAKTISDAPAINGEKTVAIVYVEGDIVDGKGEIEQAGAERISAQIRELTKDEDVLALVLRVNSPGGSVTASEQIRRQVELFAEQAPVVVSMGQMAASGGYWVITPADEIILQNSTLTGSIGVFSIFINIKDFAADWNVYSDRVTTSPFADAYSIMTPMDENELKLAHRVVDGYYRRFIELVAKGRNLPQDEVEKVAQGRIWSGSDALTAGLADGVGNLQAAVERAAKLAGLENGTYVVRDMPVEISFEEQLSRVFSSAGAVQGRAERLLTRLGAMLAQVADGKAAARLPFIVEGNW
jgi:protease-4